MPDHKISERLQASWGQADSGPDTHPDVLVAERFWGCTVVHGQRPVAIRTRQGWSSGLWRSCGHRRYSQYCFNVPSPPEAVGTKLGFPLQLEPQLQAEVSVALQYAADA